MSARKRLDSRRLSPGSPENPAPAGAARREPWAWHALIVIPPFAATLWVPFYDRADPTLGGFPFFYWYLFLWVVLTAALSGFVYAATRRES